MTHIFVEPVYTFTHNALLARNADIIIDQEYQFQNETDLTGPLHVEAGLLRPDVVVSLGYLGLAEEPLEEYVCSYLITKLNRDGSGILVLGDTVAKDPQTWVNSRIVGMWSALHRQDYFLADFDDGTSDALAQLDLYIDRQSRR